MTTAYIDSAPRNNLTSLFIPQFAYSMPLGKDYGEYNSAVNAVVGDLEGLGACLGPDGVYVKDTDDADVTDLPTVGVFARAEATGLRYGDDNARARKGTAITVLFKGTMEAFKAGNAITVGARLQPDITGRWIPTSAPTTLAEIARTPVVVIALEAAGAAGELFSAAIL